MEYKIENCNDGDADYIIDRLIEYNLSQVPAEQDDYIAACIQKCRKTLIKNRFYIINK